MATKWQANADAATTKILREVGMLSSDPGQEAKLGLQLQIRQKRFTSTYRRALSSKGFHAAVLSFLYSSKATR